MDETARPVEGASGWNDEIGNQRKPESNVFHAAFQAPRAAEHLVGLGARATLEALRQVEAGEPLDSVLAAYRQLDPKTLRALGGDRFPPLPIYEVVS